MTDRAYPVPCGVFNIGPKYRDEFMTMLTAPMPDRVLTDYPAENDRWQWNRVQRTLENEALYRGDFTPLLNGRVKSARNGLLAGTSR